jgi:hypothetical protein|tara:strand:- start:210 stop:473 length:264 start_codon:yes stop_codon:yes gene_type:complete
MAERQNTIRSIDLRVIELEKRDAVNNAERRHINERLENLDTKMEAIGTKVDEGFEKVYASLRMPIKLVAGAFIVALVAWVVNGGASI